MPMKYKGYEAVISYEEDINAFHGRVKDIRDIVSFEGSSIEELEREFQDSVDDYLVMCAERGEKPLQSDQGVTMYSTSATLRSPAYTKTQ